MIPLWRTMLQSQDNHMYLWIMVLCQCFTSENATCPYHMYQNEREERKTGKTNRLRHSCSFRRQSYWRTLAGDSKCLGEWTVYDVPGKKDTSTCTWAQPVIFDACISNEESCYSRALELRAGIRREMVARVTCMDRHIGSSLAHSAKDAVKFIFLIRTL